MRKNQNYSLLVEQTPCWAAPGDVPVRKGADSEGPVPHQQWPEDTYGHFSLGFLLNISGYDFLPQAALLSVLLHLPKFKSFMEILFSI